MDTDILIPLGQGSRHDNLELRYCLRSIEKHLTGVGNIYIIGDYPDWLHGLIHIPCTDNPNTWQRAHNIYRKIITGLPFVTDNFLFMNDDHFLLSDYVAGEFPYYHRGQVVLNDFKNNQPQYKQYQNTIRIYFGSHYYDFDVHCPILYNKVKFLEHFKGLDWPEYGYAIKTMYSNLEYDTTNWVPCEDLKFSEPLMKESIYRVLEGRLWFSIGDKCLRSGGMKEVLSELYPDKSKYEL